MRFVRLPMSLTLMETMEKSVHAKLVRRYLVCASILLVISMTAKPAIADEGGVSFWLPGTFGSLAAVPGQPGWSFAAFNYYGSVSAGADVGRAREIQIGRFNPTVNVNLNANLNSTIDFVWVQPTYTFATPVLGGQAAVGLGTFVGRNSTSLSGTSRCRSSSPHTASSASAKTGYVRYSSYPMPGRWLP